MLGGAGFIGRRIVHRLEEDGVDVHPASRERIDLRDAAEVERLAQAVDPATAVVLAAGVQRFRGDSPDLFNANVEIARGTVRLAALAGVRRIAFVSSVAVYGESTTNLAIDERTPVRPETFYGLSKTASEEILSAAAEAAGWSVLHLRPTLVYGPENYDVPYRPASFARDLSLGTMPVLWGDGSEARDFVHVDDVARATVGLLATDADGVVVLASGRGSSFRECVSLLLEARGWGGRRVPMRERTGPRSDQAFAIGRLRALLPGFDPIPLEQGMAEVWQAVSAVWGD